MAQVPTVMIWKGGKRAVVNEDSLADWEAAGWSRKAPDTAGALELDAKPPEPRKRRGTSKTGDGPPAKAES